jgi:hypothetical protein
MPTPKSSAKRKRSTFLYSTDAGTVLSMLFEYLNGTLCKTFTQREGKQRGIDAMSAFWMPYALRHQKVDPLELKQTARSSVEALSRQIRAICQDFGVESPFERVERSAELEMLLQALASRNTLPDPAVVQSASMAATGNDDRTQQVEPSLIQPDSTSVPDSVRELIFVDDEDLLGDLN